MPLRLRLAAHQVILVVPPTPHPHPHLHQRHRFRRVPGRQLRPAERQQAARLRLAIAAVGGVRPRAGQQRAGGGVVAALGQVLALKKRMDRGVMRPGAANVSQVCTMLGSEVNSGVASA